MLPQTHLLGGILVALLLRAVTPLTPMDFAISAALSVLYDADHIYAYLKRSGTASLASFWNAGKDHPGNKDKFVHKFAGLIIILPIAGAASFFGLKYGLIVISTYGLHMLMDYIHHRFNFSIRAEGRTPVQISYEEIGIDLGLVVAILWDLLL